jgi:sugar lactone lactonase YvrE
MAMPSGIAAGGPHDVSLDGRGGVFVTVGTGMDPSRRSELGVVGAELGQLVHLSSSGNLRQISDVSGFEVAANPAGGPIDSNPYGMIADAVGRTVTDAGANALLHVAINGDIWPLAVFPSRPARSTDSVPTCVEIGPDGAYYVGELTGVPFAVGAARVYRVVSGRDPEVFLGGFTAILDLTFGKDGSLYVLQHATGPGLTGNGALIRVAPDGTRATVASTGLVSPTSVAVGPDGALYVSNRGIFPGSGEVLRITP